MKSIKNEDLSIEDIDKKISEYKTNLSNIESILDREGQHKITNTKINELIKNAKELKNVIAYQEDLRKYKITTSPTILNSVPLTESDKGRVCVAYFEEEKKWFTAIINEVFEDTAEITFLGYKEKATLPFKYIKVQEYAKQEDLVIGNQCEAIFYEDGKWYNATIDNISEHGVHIKYNKYDDVEVVSFDSIRFPPDVKLLNQKKIEDKAKQTTDNNIMEFKLPDYLKLDPTDNEAQRLSKRKRVKAMKQKHKQAIIEKVSKDKQDEWLKFSQNTPKIHKFNKTK
jgi:hypothetical protein